MPLIASTTRLRLIDGVAIVLAQALQLARARVAASASLVVRLMAQRDHDATELELLRRELDVLRAQRASVPPHRRPEYPPAQRLAIVQLLRLRNWRLAVAAQRFVVHENTLREWIKAVEGRGNTRLLAAAIVWNRLDDAVRWAVHELRRLCPEPELGTRTIARHLIRAGIQLSRSTAQRVLRERKPQRPPRRRPPMATALDVEPYHLLTPTKPNRVWHLDLTHLRVLWWHWTVAAILDGATPRLLALRVHAATPRSSHLAALVRGTIRRCGRPRFLITDRGTQFRHQFGAAMERTGVTHVRGRVRAPFLNGKLERFFRGLKGWWRWQLPPLTTRSLQRRLNSFQEWHNLYRPHAALRGRTPEEAWLGKPLPQPRTFLAAHRIKPSIQIARRSCRGDPRLPILRLSVCHGRAA